MNKILLLMVVGIMLVCAVLLATTEIAIEKTPIIAPMQTAFGAPTTLAIGEKITFTDGLELTLIKINDSRCKAGVVCVWAGELAGAFQITGGGTGAMKEFNLGTATSKSATINSYTFTLESVTETSITITVRKRITEALPTGK